MKTFIDDMIPREAARYRRYWQCEALTQIIPSKHRTTDLTKLSTNSEEVCKRVNHYDEYGRLKGQTHYSRHPLQRGIIPIRIIIGEIIIVFTDRHDDDESRYHRQDWQLAEKEASEDYRTGKIKSADSIDRMFEEIEKNADENQMVA